MDAAAFSLCMENRIPIVVLNVLKKAIYIILVDGKRLETIVSTGEEEVYSA